MASVKAIIEDIRKNEYGIGLKTDPAVKKVLEKSLARTNRALERLSDELYTKDTHFVLELIQNADDNKYQGAIKPLLRFEIDKTAPLCFVRYNIEVYANGEFYTGDSFDIKVK